MSCAPEAHADRSSLAARGADAPRQSDGTVRVGDERDGNGHHRQTILFKNFQIEGIYPSMRGPWNRTLLGGPGSPGARSIWITRYRAEVLDEKTGAASQEFMCHTNVDLVGARAGGGLASVHAQLSISQGQQEIDFPPGLALKIDVAPDQMIDVSAMVLNNNDASIRRTLDFKATLDYEDDAGAARLGLAPLFQGAVWTSCALDAADAVPGETVCRAASGAPDQRDVRGRHATGHWIVPPGRQVIVNDVDMPVKTATTLHYVWMHVHPYAESMELWDRTEGRAVFQGTVVNAKGRAAVVSTDHYSDPKGLPVYPDHRYELITVYDNPTGHDIDAMAALWMYFRAAAAERSPESRSTSLQSGMDR
jgi:hypothetical protein